MGTHTKVSVISLALLGLVACASSENSADDMSPSGDGDGDGDTSGTGKPGEVQIESIDVEDGEKIATANYIDNLEDGDDLVMANDKRLGSWYTFADEQSKTGKIMPGESFKPTAGGANDSKFAAKVTGSGFATTEYAGLGFDFNNDGKVRKTYDASKFKGITFQAKGKGDLRVGFSTPASTGEGEDGGECKEDEKKMLPCDDTHGVDISLEADWAKYDIPFAKIKQEGWGVPAGEFDAKKLLSISFGVPEEQLKSFEFYIDEVGFF